MKILQYDGYSKYFSELILFDGRTFRIIRTHPIVIGGQWNKCVEMRFWTIFSKTCGWLKIPHSKFAEKFWEAIWSFLSHRKHSATIFSSPNIVFSKLKFRSWKFLSGVYVIFIEFFEVNKSLQCSVQGIRHFILNQISEFC